jgi:hypothetical protein
MHRSIVSLTLALIVALAVACSGGADRSSLPSETGPSFERHHNHRVACRDFGDDLMQDLFPRGMRGDVRARIAFIRLRYRFGDVTRARLEMFHLWDLVLKAYYAGTLRGGMSGDTQDNVLQFGQLIYCLVGLDGSGLALGDALGDGDVTVVVYPSGDNQDVVHGDGDGGIRFPGGSLGAPATATVSLITDSFDPYKGPLQTKLDQYGPFFELHVVPEGSIVQPVLVAECLAGTLPPSVHLAHNVGTGIVILGLETSFLNCNGTGEAPITLREYLARREFGGAIKHVAERALSLVSPTLAYAGGTGVGGKTSNFSPFGGVDTNVVVDAASPLSQTAPAGSPVASPPKVLVHTTGANTPLDGANVTFAITSGGGSLTGGSAVTDVTGTATVGSWTVGVGANSMTASASFPAPPVGTGVGISNSPVTFTATGGDIIPWQGDGYRYLVGPADHDAGFQATGFNDAGWSVGRAAFGDHNANNLYCALDASVNTNWASVPPPTDMLLRHTFPVPAGWTNDLSVSIAIDNDIQVFVNGTDVTATASSGYDSESGFVIHEGCATRGSTTFSVAHTLLTAGTNVIAVRARDRGVDALVDLQVTAVVVSP